MKGTNVFTSVSNPESIVFSFFLFFLGMSSKCLGRLKPFSHIAPPTLYMHKRIMHDLFLYFLEQSLTLPLPSILVPTPFTKGGGGGGDQPDPLLSQKPFLP